MDKTIRTKELFASFPSYIAPLFSGAEYPWEVLPHIGDYVRALMKEGIPGFTLFSPTVLIGPGVKIAPTATIEGTAVIGEGTEIRPGAYLRGNVLVGSDCVIGNSSELKNCVLLDKVQIPHYNYIGDSVLGNRAHTGAGTICSNLKSDGMPVTVHAEQDIPTGLRKFGAILADGADVGCNAVMNPGTVIGQNTSVYPLTSLRGVYPKDSIVKATRTVVKRQKNEDLR